MLYEGWHTGGNKGVEVEVKGIIFKSDEVNAILDGRKTTFRKVAAEKSLLDVIWGLDKEPYEHEGQWFLDKQTEVDCFETIRLNSRYNTEDILYVKETWRRYTKRFGEGEGCYFETLVAYKADEDKQDNPSEFYFGNEGWKPSVHMTKLQSRVFLKITGVRIERLQDITEDDAEKEMSFELMQSLCAGFTGDYRTAFERFWNSSIKKKDLDKYGWEANPWVWVYEFERVGMDAKKPVKNAYTVNYQGEYDIGYMYACPNCECDDVGKYSKEIDEWDYYFERCWECAQKLDWRGLSE